MDSRLRRLHRPSRPLSLRQPCGSTIIAETRECPPSVPRKKGRPEAAFIRRESACIRRDSAAGAGSLGSPSFSRSSRMSSSRLVATSRRRVICAPVPAGIRRPTMTFSLRPSSVSCLPLTAASVRTRVVSWNEAAEMNERVCRLALVMPSRTGCAVGGLLALFLRLRVDLVELDPVDLLACRSARSRRSPRSRPSAASGERSPRCACR